MVRSVGGPPAAQGGGEAAAASVDPGCPTAAAALDVLNCTLVLKVWLLGSVVVTGKAALPHPPHCCLRCATMFVRIQGVNVHNPFSFTPTQKDAISCLPANWNASCCLVSSACALTGLVW